MLRAALARAFDGEDGADGRARRVRRAALRPGAARQLPGGQLPQFGAGATAGDGLGPALRDAPDLGCAAARSASSWLFASGGQVSKQYRHPL